MCSSDLQLRNLDVHWSDDPSILVYSKQLHGDYIRSGRSDAIIIVANVDPHAVRETTVHLDLTRLGLEADATFEVTDLITKDKFTWGADNYVRLDPFREPVHVLSVDLSQRPLRRAQGAGFAQGAGAAQAANGDERPGGSR